MLYDYKFKLANGEKLEYSRMTMANMIKHMKEKIELHYGLKNFVITRNILFNIMANRSKNIFLKEVVEICKSANCHQSPIRVKNRKPLVITPNPIVA
jgi:hypothetical protein